MPYLKTNRAKIYYEEHGENGPPLVFAHGVGGNSLAWWQQIPHFAQSRRVVVFDHRGFGRSSDDDRLGRSQFVNDLEALIDHLGLENPILIGQSMGGIACSGYLARHPGNVAALVMADTLLGVEFPPGIEKELTEERAKHEGLPQIERAMSRKTLTGRPELPYLFSHISAFNEVNRLTLEGDFERANLEQLAATGVPVLFVVGAEDFLFAPRFIKAVHHGLAGSEYAEIPETGHSPYFENADAFNRVIDGFFAKHGL